jgi:hypothetical protein
MVALTLILLHKEGLVTDVGGCGSGSGCGWGWQWHLRHIFYTIDFFINRRMFIQFILNYSFL